MAKNVDAVAVKDAIHKLQLGLYEGIRDETQLFAAGSLMSQSDYQDVVTERSIADKCGYPLCSNSLPSERPRKGRYRISLKEHKVYDLHETYMYCSTSCVVSSRAFTGSLQEERRSVLNSAKLGEVLKLFEGLSLDSKEDLGTNADFGISELKIEEREDTKVGEKSLKEWVGPSNAIEGYVPQRDRGSRSSRSKNQNKGSKLDNNKTNKGKDTIFNEMDFMSTIITEDEYTVSKIPSVLLETGGSETNIDEVKRKRNLEALEHQFSLLETPSAPERNGSETIIEESNGKTKVLMNDKLSISKKSALSRQNGSDMNGTMVEKEVYSGKGAQSNTTVLKPSLKSSGAKKVTHSVTWADKQTDSESNKDLCEFEQLEDNKEATEGFVFTDKEDGDDLLRFQSAEACAIALSEAADAVTSGESAVPDAVSEAGIIILPPPHDMDTPGSEEDMDLVDPEPAPLKWPRKPGISESDFFDSEDSWYDSPPEGFTSALSPFATMYTALFEWISSSSLAYIYGRDESFHEEYSSVNGREYPRKIVATDGRSSEIKQTLAGCLARALPGLVTDLRLPTPVSTLEQGMGCLLDTMSFFNPLPPFRMKQWQVLVLLFIDALSVCRIPAQMASRRRLFHKVLDGAQISEEEYEVMKDLIIPLGRVPQFSAQSGG